MRTKDQTYLHSLGPYACAMWMILAHVEYNREDKLTPGIDMNIDEYLIEYYRGCFIIYRGGAMKPEWVYGYQQEIGNYLQFEL